jgi:hypothetical protein
VMGLSSSGPIETTLHGEDEDPAPRHPSYPFRS